MDEITPDMAQWLCDMPYELRVRLIDELDIKYQMSCDYIRQLVPGATFDLGLLELTVDVLDQVTTNHRKLPLP